MIKSISLIFLLLILAARSGLAEESFVYNSKGKRDPLMALVTSQGYIIRIEEELVASDMDVEGVIFDPQGRSMAIINGKVVKVGDNIGSYTVVEIDNNRVVLNSAGEQYVIEMKRGE